MNIRLINSLLNSYTKATCLRIYMPSAFSASTADLSNAFTSDFTLLSGLFHSRMLEPLKAFGIALSTLTQ
jgi:hypothetical protein